MSTTSIIVAGLGAAGSAAAWRLAAAGHRVIGLDRWAPPHPHGSTHGETRVTRVTAWEGATYVPLVQRANALWDELEVHAGSTLRRRIGGLFVGRPEETIIAGTIASAQQAGVACAIHSGEQLRGVAPGLRAPAGMVGVSDPGAGLLDPEAGVRAMHEAARAQGAELRLDTPMQAWRAAGDGVEVTTATDSLHADRLVLAMGPWMRDVLAPLGVPLVIERQTMHWFVSTNARCADRPVLILGDGHDHATVVFPAIDGAVKVAGHGSEDFVDPDRVDRTVRREEIAPMEALLHAWLPDTVGAHLRSATCLYTRTPSGHFLLDRHPEHPQVVLASPCNGFGFKFAPAVGEALAALATGAEAPVDLSPWRLPQR